MFTSRIGPGERIPVTVSMEAKQSADAARARSIFRHLLACEEMAFPLPLPVTLLSGDVARVMDTHVVTEKSDGVRCAFIVGTIDGRTVVGCLDRSMDFFALPLAAPQNFECIVEGRRAQLDHGTILDAEWMADARTLLVFDAMTVAGYRVDQIETFAERLAHAQRVCDQLRPRGWSCRVKRFRSVRDCVACFESATLACDGLIFQPKNGPVGRFQDPRVKKWKPLHTLDLQWDGVQWLEGGGGHRRVACDVQPETAAHLPPGIYECAPARGDRWTVLKRREDKTFPNHGRTVRATLETIADGLSLERLRALAGVGNAHEYDAANADPVFVLGIDVGLRNLALCLIRSDLSNSKEDPSNRTETPVTSVLAWHVLDVLGMLETKQVDIPKAVELVVRRLQSFDFSPLPQDRKRIRLHVAIEAQPVGRQVSGNIRMKCVSHAIQSFFLMSFPACTVTFVNPKNKFARELVEKVAAERAIEAPDLPEGKLTNKQRYAQHKKLAARLVSAVVEGTEYVSWYRALKKKDDAADSYLLARIHAETVRRNEARERKKQAQQQKKAAKATKKPTKRKQKSKSSSAKRAKTAGMVL